MADFVTPALSDEQKARFLEVQGDGVALLSITFDGEPTAAIVSVAQIEEGGDYFITPLAVLVTEAMIGRMRDPEGHLPQEGAQQ